MQDRRSFVQSVIAASVGTLSGINLPLPNQSPRITRDTGWVPDWPFEERMVYWPYIGKLCTACEYYIPQGQYFLAMSYLYDPSLSLKDLQAPVMVPTEKDQFNPTFLTATLSRWQTTMIYIDGGVHDNMAMKIAVGNGMEILRKHVVKEEMKIA